jgi:rhamnose transport system substrate-binding protein
MVAYPDLGGILALTPSGISAADDAVTRMQRAGKVEVVGVAPPGAAGGAAVPIVTSNLDDAAYLAAQAAAALVNGAITGAPGEQFEAGALGPVVVGDGSVVVAPPIVLAPKGGFATPSP